ncbi:MAG: hypothetical protein US42_C0011G0061 [Candidatus Magasanikbacteria bacterium GW2011_GWC2_37_14]|uniref:Metallo-beta-lactamase domain-containing protein 1 n=1 Tax=Candidatus Magasanikbacteria bacterium GW2011_GWC2_37_14 TaxID=1619046 RepID=A0A0G0G891_9BACT|nr:MAG: hypothetical protein US42_C0011G0061 [Candidatus Magasanikbacteria bacterium GW2011_GWC2_37_14]
MTEVKVLVEGVHEMNADGKMDLGATTTLIKSNINIIVDPGAFVNKDKLLKALKDEGLKTTDIQAVILTHTHIDHTTNIFLFPQAIIYNRFIHSNYLGQTHKIVEGCIERFDIVNEPIADNVKVIETIGHTIDHVSVVVETELGKIVIAGDAINGVAMADMNIQADPDFLYSLEEYNKSREKILAIADYIIPGHEAMFKVGK